MHNLWIWTQNAEACTLVLGLFTLNSLQLIYVTYICRIDLDDIFLGVNKA